MKKLNLTSMLSHILNALSKGVFNMDAIAVITALYIALWVGVYKDDIKRDLGLDKPKVEQTEKVNGDTTNTQK
jgi:predicted GNAT superfamily acetyltransferase